jgi:hypothetical protein
MKTSKGQNHSRQVIGRKPAIESRATEFRKKLMLWVQSPEWSRLSLRALACQLGTSHQLLTFYLKGLDVWRGQQYLREASQIRSVASAEGRQLTEWEEQRAYACTRAGVRAISGAMLRDSIKRMKKESELRALCPQEIKSLTILARQFPEAQELLQKGSLSGVKSAKNNLPPISADSAKSFRSVGGNAEKGWQLR